MARPKNQFLVTTSEGGDVGVPDAEVICTNLPTAIEEVERLVKSDEEPSTVRLWKQIPFKATREVVVTVKLNGHKRRKKKDNGA